MGTDCGLLIKVKGEEKKYYKRQFDRLYCFQRISIGPDFDLEHEGLQDHNGLVESRRKWQGEPVFVTTDEIKMVHALQWAHDRIAFLRDNRAAIEAENDSYLRVDYHLHWVTQFLLTLLELEKWDNIETLWLATDNGETYDDIVFDDENEVIDLKKIAGTPFPEHT